MMILIETIKITLISPPGSTRDRTEWSFPWSFVRVAASPLLAIVKRAQVFSAFCRNFALNTIRIHEISILKYLATILIASL